jgi:integrase
VIDIARGSVVSQVNLALQALNRIGRRKTTAKRKREGIYHGQTMKSYIRRCCTYVKWARERYGIRYLVELNEVMTREYFKELRGKGQSAYYMLGVRSALKKLELGIRKVFHKNVRIVPKDLELPRRSLKLRRNCMAYTDEQVEAILKEAHKINDEAAKALELQVRFGLRITEVLKLRKKDVHFERGMLVVWRGKGGRLREVPIEDEESRALLFELCMGKEEDDLLFKDLSVWKLEWEVMKRACTAAGIKASRTHNLRHTYAVRQYEKRIREGKTNKEARKEVSLLMGHNRLDVTYSYVPSRRYRL